MAEVVFQHLEGMLPELEDMERMGVFSREELRIIIKKRTDFEYKLQKRVVEKHDILKYLEYELNLDLLLKKRLKRLKLKKYTTAGMSVTKRIHDIFQKAVQKFGDDLQLWLKYVEFCKSTDSKRALGKVFAKLMQAHASNPDVWILAAKHEFEESGNPETARSLMQRALRNNRQSTKLWHEYFRLELMHIEKIKKRREMLGVGGIDLKGNTEIDPEMMEEFLSNKIPHIVYKNAIKDMPEDIEFRLRFLDISREFPDHENTVEIIHNSLLEDFATNELTYHSIAQLPLYNLSSAGDRIIKDSEWEKAEDECKAKYFEGLDQIKTVKMWELFTQTLSSLIQKSKSPDQAKRRVLALIEIYGMAEEKQLVSEEMYLAWIDLLENLDDNEAAISCSDRALKTHKQSLDLWKKFLQFRLDVEEDVGMILKDFKRCLDSVEREDRVVVWEMMLDLAVSAEYENVQQLFQESLNGDDIVRDCMFCKYLQWTLSTKGIKEVRELYKKKLGLVTSLDIISECLLIEKSQVPVSKKHIRQLFEKAVLDHGTSSPDIWLDWITFEQSIPETCIEKTGEVYLKAKRTLEKDLIPDFITKYTLRTTEPS